VAAASNNFSPDFYIQEKEVQEVLPAAPAAEDTAVHVDVKSRY